MVLTSGLKKIIGTKAFYKAALAFAIPLILQDTVSSFVNLLDNMMIGSLGTEQMSGVAIVNQFINLFTMCIYGGVAGANIFAAQYIGNNDNKNAQHAIRFNFIMVTCFSALFIAVMYLFQDKLISAFLHTLMKWSISWMFPSEYAIIFSVISAMFISVEIVDDVEKTN